MRTPCRYGLAKPGAPVHPDGLEAAVCDGGCAALEPGNPQHERVKKFSERQDSGLRLQHHARSQISLEPDFLPSVIVTLVSFYELLLTATNKTKP